MLRMSTFHGNVGGQPPKLYELMYVFLCWVNPFVWVQRQINRNPFRTSPKIRQVPSLRPLLDRLFRAAPKTPPAKKRTITTNTHTHTKKKKKKKKKTPSRSAAPGSSASEELLSQSWSRACSARGLARVSLAPVQRHMAFLYFTSDES